MESSMSFGEILEEVDKLPIIDQESLKDILAKGLLNVAENSLHVRLRRLEQNTKQEDAGL